MLDASPRPFEQLLLAIAMGAMLSMAAAHLRAQRPLQRWIGVTFDLSVGAYAFKLWSDCTPGVNPVLVAVSYVLAVGAVGWFHLFVLTLFEDAGKLRPAQFIPLCLLILIGFANGYMLPKTGWRVFVAINVIQLGLVAHALSVIWRGWKGDLVEARRRMRAPILGVIAVYIIVGRIFENLAGFHLQPDWWPLVNAAMLAFVCIAGSLVFIEARSDFFGPAIAPIPRAAPLLVAGQDRALQADLDRLEKLMGCDEVWREEGLTIASLALKANMPETQLRRLICDHLGFRNFPSFVNTRRIAAAKSRLQNPDEARVSISTIAFEIGFGSLGPFNRAFREATGQSPSEWRREALNGGADSAGEAPADGSPISRPA